MARTMNAPLRLTAAASLALVAGCATVAVTGDPAVEVFATAETEPVGTAAEDAADDPAIWRNPSDPAASLIVATDKKAGLHVYGLDGASRSFTDAGLLNNVDLVDLGESGIIVVASDRNDPARARLQVFRLDPASAQLTPLGSLDGGTGEAYGVCMRRDGDGVRIASILKDGRILEQTASTTATGVERAAPALPERRVASQSEGCVYDTRDGSLYVGEENAGIWRFPEQGEGTLVAPVDNRMLVADVEGLAVLEQGSDGGYLVASSQGDNAYAVFALPAMQPVGRFRIAAGTYGATEETDGIALTPGDFGEAFPGGLFVAQDGSNEPEPQNFKLVPLDAVLGALHGYPREGTGR